MSDLNDLIRMYNNMSNESPDNNKNVEDEIDEHHYAFGVTNGWIPETIKDGRKVPVDGWLSPEGVYISTTTGKHAEAAAFGLSLREKNSTSNSDSTTEDILPEKNFGQKKISIDKYDIDKTIDACVDDGIDVRTAILRKGYLHISQGQLQINTRVEVDLQEMVTPAQRQVLKESTNEYDRLEQEISDKKNRAERIFELEGQSKLMTEILSANYYHTDESVVFTQDEVRFPSLDGRTETVLPSQSFTINREIIQVDPEKSKKDLLDRVMDHLSKSSNPSLNEISIDVLEKCFFDQEALSVFIDSFHKYSAVAGSDSQNDFLQAETRHKGYSYAFLFDALFLMSKVRGEDRGVSVSVKSRKERNMGDFDRIMKIQVGNEEPIHMYEHHHLHADVQGENSGYDIAVSLEPKAKFKTSTIQSTPRNTDVPYIFMNKDQIMILSVSKNSNRDQNS